MLRRIAVTLLLLSGCSRDVTLPDPPGPGSVSGRVLLARPGESEKRPLANVEIRLLGSGEATTTSPAGTFTLPNIEATSGLLLFRVDVDGERRQRVVQLSEHGTGPNKQVNLGDIVIGANATVRGKVLSLPTNGQAVNTLAGLGINGPNSSLDVKNVTITGRPGPVVNSTGGALNGLGAAGVVIDTVTGGANSLANVDVSLAGGNEPQCILMNNSVALTTVTDSTISLRGDNSCGDGRGFSVTNSSARLERNRVYVADSAPSVAMRFIGSSNVEAYSKVHRLRARRRHRGP